jgi:hypothetical protein
MWKSKLKPQELHFSPPVDIVAQILTHKVHPVRKAQERTHMSVCTDHSLHQGTSLPTKTRQRSPDEWDRERR